MARGPDSGASHKVTQAPWGSKISPSGVCVVFYLLYRGMRPEGPWQRLAAALADSSRIFIHGLTPIPNS